MRENTVDMGAKPADMGLHTLMERGVDKNAVGEMIKRHYDRKRRAAELQVLGANGR